jgi:hypothetical protein
MVGALSHAQQEKLEGLEKRDRKLTWVGFMALIELTFFWTEPILLFFESILFPH